MEKCQFCGFFKLMFLWSKKGFFYDLCSRFIRWEYRGLQGFTGDYKGWQRVTGGLQGVTGGYKGVTGGYEGFRRGYKGFEGITRGYRCLERVRGFKRGILFFFITKVAENLNWWRNRTVETFRILPETMTIYVCMNLFVKVDLLIIVP